MTLGQNSSFGDQVQRKSVKSRLNKLPYLFKNQICVKMFGIVHQSAQQLLVMAKPMCTPDVHAHMWPLNKRI